METKVKRIEEKGSGGEGDKQREDQQDGERQAWRQTDTDEHGRGLQPGL